MQKLAKVGQSNIQINMTGSGRRNKPRCCYSIKRSTGLLTRRYPVVAAPFIVPTLFRQKSCVFVLSPDFFGQRATSLNLYKTISNLPLHGYEPGGREFESLRARHFKSHSYKIKWDFLSTPVGFPACTFIKKYCKRSSRCGVTFTHFGRFSLTLPGYFFINKVVGR